MIKKTSIRSVGLVLVSGFLVAFGAVSCNKNPGLEAGMPSDEVVFTTRGAVISYSEGTKASVVNDASLQSSGFYASATTGVAGEEVSDWNSQPFTYGGGMYAGDKWWPASNPNYHFYASNVALTHTASGNTVSASNATDVVVAYLPTPTYKTVNSLTFEHVFARLGALTVSAETGYTVSDVSVRIVPKTGGTFNIAAGYGVTDGSAGWSDVTSGPSTVIANTVGENANDIYLVPGTYEILATWTAAKGDYTETFTDSAVNVDLEGGKLTAMTATLGGRGAEILFELTVTPLDTESPAALMAFPKEIEGYAGFAGNVLNADNSSPMKLRLSAVSTAQSLGNFISYESLDGVDGAIPWNVEFSENDGVSWSASSPAWLTLTYASHAGSVSAGEEVFATVGAAYLESRPSCLVKFSNSRRSLVYSIVLEDGSEPLTVTAVTPGYLALGIVRDNYPVFSRSLEYSLNGGEWTECSFKDFDWFETEFDYHSTSHPFENPNIFYLSAGDVLQLRDDSDDTYSYYFEDENSWSSFQMLIVGDPNLTFNLSGDIMSLLGGDDAVMPAFAFAGLFADNLGLLSAADLELPATTLTNYCYVDMFWGCESLTTAPALPAMTLAEGCYQSMFHNCLSLEEAPALPAMTLAEGCYGGMFGECTSLTAAPELPATTLAGDCYSTMFRGCESLTTAPALPAMTLAEWCYHMMFGGCTSLTAAPELLATTLAPYCYSRMFVGCTSLTSITCLATDISAEGATNDWVDCGSNYMPSGGTFTRAPGVVWPVGLSGIPSGWIVQDAS